MQYPLDEMGKHCYCNDMSKGERTDPKGFIVRVEAAREALGLGPYELSERIGKGQSYWSVWVNRHRERGGFPAGDVMAALADVLQVSNDYLLGRTEASIPEPPRVTLEELLSRIGAEPVPVDDTYLIEDFAVSAGPGTAVPQDFDDTIPRRRRRKKGPEGVFRVRVRGRCMEPEIHQGDVIYFDTTLTPKPGQVVIAVVEDEESVIKRLVERDGRRCLESLDGRSIEIDARVRIVGVAVGGQYRLL